MPRLTAKTMGLPAPVAFAAALIGGALGGILFAFLALPAAGVIQAAVRTYGRHYKVVEDDTAVVPALTPRTGNGEREPPATSPLAKTQPSPGPRTGPGLMTGN